MIVNYFTARNLFQRCRFDRHSIFRYVYNIKKTKTVIANVPNLMKHTFENAPTLNLQ